LRPTRPVRRPFPTLRPDGRCVWPRWNWVTGGSARPAPSWALAGMWRSFRIYAWRSPARVARSSCGSRARKRPRSIRIGTPLTALAGAFVTISSSTGPRRPARELMARRAGTRCTTRPASRTGDAV